LNKPQIAQSYATTFRPFYGYHAREHQFFKIFLFNPSLTRKVANMLQSEVILGRLYQPHESHIPYILQFMIDYNLHGMSRVLLSELKFRTNSPPKQSTCELEADALCEHILNRLEVAQGNLGVNPGIAALWEDERQRLRDKNEDSQIGPCLTLDNSQVEPTKTHKIFKRALSEKLCLSENVAESVDQSISVYPAETPRDRSLKNASFIEVHSSHSTSADESVDLNATFDDDAKDLFEILQDLGRKNVEVEEVDSILSQTQKEEEEEDGEEENFLDLSISMADTTPFKKFIDSLKDDEEINTSSDLLDTTLVPQLDGQNDGSSDEESGKSKRVTQKSKGASKYVALPIFLSSPSVNNRSQELQEGSEGKLSDDLDHVKRKLNFKTSSEVTICEDSLECEYKSEDKENICKVDTLPNQDKVEELMEENSRESLAQSEGLTVAELYDLRTNYRPKEGCSTKLTQNSQVSELKLSSESSSDLLTPNQVNGYDSDQVSRQSCKLSQDLTPTPDLSLSQETKSEPKPVSNENSRLNYCVITPKRKPPSRDDVINSLETLNIPKIVHQVPFYGDVSDVTGSVEIGHSVLKIHSKTSAHLEDWKTHFNGLEAYRKKAMPANVKWSHENIKKLKLSFCSAAPCVITPVKRPPTVEEVEEWLKKRSEALPKPKVEKEEIKKIRVPLSPGRLEESDMELSLTISPCDNDTTARSDSTTTSPVLGKESKKRKPLPKRFTNSCQITGVTLNNTYGFRITPENFQNARAVNEHQHVTILSLEVHVGTRGDLKPDPAYDSVGAIFYSIVEDGPESVDTSGVIAVGAIKSSEVGCDLRCVDTEEELFGELLKLIKKWDPDILVGYETELLSWGYLLERSQILGNKLLSSLSRIKDSRNNNEDRGLQITGRILLDVWRLLRHEIALQSYSFESIVYHLLHKRIALYSFKDLTTWWNNPLFRHRTLSHYLFRVRGVLQILEQLDLVGRTSELARLFGIQFYEVLSRGSQFRVESMMLRLAKPLNYIPVSPSVQQRAKMKAPEFLPLILEPESKLYVDPVIVLDFQSLYPSMIIAYNYCFSTCIGRATHLGRNAPFEFGATQLRVSRARVKKLLNNDSLNFSPCGVAYVKSSVRDGILPKMLREILDTRLMVKNSMKKNKEDGVLQKVLHNRQLGLKLIANVTYGYTAANFSGRMPAVELADSVVSKGRETLQRAIEMVENTPEWKAKVVYGDTDSLFVLVPGRSRDEAFEIGRKIADAVTEDNPDPVKLKLEKVYHPCILQTKKRYVGYMYESPDQSEPVYLAKGIETVRRDGCPAVAKVPLTLF
jgi:DNA polymerase zeta